MQDGHGDHSDVTVVVPAFNEVASVGQVVTDLRQVFAHVVVVDDGSVDDTSGAARRAGATVVRHPVNLGQGAALQTGFAFALTDPGVGYVLTFDSDGQHRVSDAVAMVAHAKERRVDVVLGSRFLSHETELPRLRRLVLRAAVRFTRWTTGLRLTDAHNGLRVLNRRTLEAVELTMNDMAHASQLLSLVAERGLTYEEVPVTIDYTDYSRSRGQSNLNALNILFDLAVERLRARR